MILHEPTELFLNQHATPVVEVVPRHLLDVVLNVGSLPSLAFDFHLLSQEHVKRETQNEKEPEVSVPLEFKTPIVVHRVRS